MRAAQNSPVAIIGAGATGTRAARQLLHKDALDVLVVDDGLGQARSAAQALGRDVAYSEGSTAPEGVQVVVLCARPSDHVRLARQSLDRGQHVVSVSDDVGVIRRLLDLNDVAERNQATLVVGAGMMPGLTDVLVAHGASRFDEIDEIHVAKFGTGGPDCARQHHRALKGACVDWRAGEWVRRAGGSGRELSWFPSPVEAADCYRAALGDPLLLARLHPEAGRITARMAATRRDRLTMHLPMLRRPHPEGLLGAVRAELRGRRNGAMEEMVLGCAERPAVAAGTVAAAAVSAILRSREPGVRGLAEAVETVPFLHDLIDRGLRLEIFTGAGDL